MLRQAGGTRRAGPEPLGPAGKRPLTGLGAALSIVGRRREDRTSAPTTSSMLVPAERPGPQTEPKQKAVAGWALLAPDGRYLDADPVALDLYCVTLAELRDRHVGDFSPDDFIDLTRHLWNLWVASGLASAEGGGTVLRGDGRLIRLWLGLERQDDGNIRMTIKPVDEAFRQAPALRVQNVLGQWRDLERHLADVAPDDDARDEIESRIDALREEYQRRTGQAR